MATNLGDYLGKTVYYEDIYSLEDIKNLETTTNAVLAIYASIEDADITRWLCFFNKLIYYKPLSILITGRFSDKIFDALLEILSVSSTEHHIMTYLSDKNWLDDLFLAAFPVEDVFDKWDHYVIFQIGSLSVKSEVGDYLGD